jgi:Protein of unknown function (DUF664)
VIDDFAKRYLHGRLSGVRETMLWKLEGLSDYDVRRPLTYSGTNLLGLIKHLSISESWYFGEVFDRPFPGTWHRSDDPAGHADILREQLDASVGFDAEVAAQYEEYGLDAAFWETRRAHIEQAARAAAPPQT